MITLLFAWNRKHIIYYVVATIQKMVDNLRRLKTLERKKRKRENGKILNHNDLSFLLS